MRKITLFFTGILVFFSLVNAQNGFEPTDLGIEFSKYAIDESGNYWLVTDDAIYKYQDAENIAYDETNTNLSYTSIKDVIIYEGGMYVITDMKVFDFNFDDPQQCIDLGLNEQITKAYLSNNKLIVFTIPSVPNIKIQVYSDGVWTEADDVPNFATINSAKYFNGIYYVMINGYGLYEYDGEEFELISEIAINDIQQWSGVLWFISNNAVYNLHDGELNRRTVTSRIYGGDELAVMNGELWSGGDEHLNKIDFDRIQGFEIPQGFTHFPSCLPNSANVSFSYSSKVIEFNEEEYISDPTFLNSENGRFLDVNNVEAAFNMRNSLFWDLQGTAHYKVPKDGKASSIFATALWFGGKDAEGDLHVSADKFDLNSVFTPGPLRLDNGQTDEGTIDQFNRIWKIDRATIENFKYRFENGQIQDGTWPVDYEIASWPAHGPEGYAENLAPFVDINEDGVYNPMDGDYPDIEGDQTLYWIINDNAEGGTPADQNKLSPELGIEVHFKAWANVYENADNDSLEAINNATFLDVEIINRSDTTYTDFYSAIWSDADLGYAFDDYIECDVMNHSYFLFNGDDNDEGSGPGYGTNPPAQSVTFLDAPVNYSIPDADTGIYMSSFMYYQNGGGDFGDPTLASDYYNYMNAKWKDSTDLTFGGNGVDNTDVPCRYMFPGNSDIVHNIGTGGVEVPDWNTWSMYNSDHTPADVRGVAANGPYDLEPGQKVTYRFVFVWARDEETGSKYSSYFKLKEILPYFHQWQRAGEFPSNYDIQIVPIGINPQPASALGVELYPNPANNSVTLKCETENAVYNIYSLSGKLMKTGQIASSSQTIGLENMNPGMYVVHITDDNVSVTKKLIIEF